jgi:hypothetical protein
VLHSLKVDYKGDVSTIKVGASPAIFYWVTG